MSYGLDALHNLIDMGSLGTVSGTTLNYKRDPYVHPEGSMHKASMTVAHMIAFGKHVGTDACLDWGMFRGMFRGTFRGMVRGMFQSML